MASTAVIKFTLGASPPPVIIIILVYVVSKQYHSSSYREHTPRLLCALTKSIP